MEGVNICFNLGCQRTSVCQQNFYCCLIHFTLGHIHSVNSIMFQDLFGPDLFWLSFEATLTQYPMFQPTEPFDVLLISIFHTFMSLLMAFNLLLSLPVWPPAPLQHPSSHFNQFCHRTLIYPSKLTLHTV